MLQDLALQVLLLISFPLYFSFQKNSKIRQVEFYVYLSLILLLGGFFGSLYTFQFNQSLNVSGGIILYATFMMTSVIFVFIERDLFVLRNIARLVLVVGLFKVLLFSSVVSLLGHDGILNPNNVPPQLFELSIPFVILGGLLIVTELLLLVKVFDWLKGVVEDEVTLILLYTLSFIGALLLDGIIFPVLAVGFNMQSVSIIIGNFQSKLLLAVVFALPLLFFMLFNRNRLKAFVESPVIDWRVLFSTEANIVKHLEQKEEALRLVTTAFDHSRDGIVIVDASFRIKNLNQSFQAYLLCMDNIIGADIFHVLPPLQAQQSHIHSALHQHQHWQQEVQWYLRDKLATGLFTMVAVTNQRSEVTHYVCTLSDISELTDTREELRYQANHDPLTDMANRRYLQITLEETDYPVCSVLLLDLDNFKVVNDSFGHICGDMVLVEIARRLNKIATKDVLVFRMGGDEFCLVVRHRMKQHELIDLAEQLRATICQPVKLNNNRSVQVDCCIGISLLCTQQNVNDYSDLFEQADTALYWAKGIRKGSIRFYSPTMTSQRRSQLKLQNELRNAIDDGRITCYFQPKLDLHTNEITGAEALVRWQETDGRFISPFDFIPLAEDVGLIDLISELVLRQTCTLLNRCHDAGRTDIRIAVNISPKQFQSRNVETLIDNSLQAHNLTGESLEIEITESALMEQESEMVPILKRLQQAGITVALDDFGTGYSNLSHLHVLPVDTLKIDRSFVMGLPDVPSSVALTQTIISLARNKHCKIVAEGVETEEQRAYLASLGCEYYQGFLYSAAVPADEFIAMLGQG